MYEDSLGGCQWDDLPLDTKMRLRKDETTCDVRGCESDLWSRCKLGSKE